ncbi:MAG TPA: response regulator [Polyangiales bacterium]
MNSSHPPEVDQGILSPRVLVAEDNEFNADLVLQLLRTRHYEATLARGGRQAIELLRHGGYDALLLDVHMPDVDGFEVVRSLRAQEAATGEHLPVIALTALARDEDRERCLAAGMDAFLTKPVDAVALWRVLEQFTGSRL